MGTTYHWPALITLLTMLLLFGCVIFVGRVRMSHRIAPPVTSGPEAFERSLRVLMNTVENVVLFLPTLWIAAIYSSPRIAALVGAVWLAARVWYAFGYAHAARARSMPFMVATIAWAALFVIAAWGLLTSPLW